MARIRIFATSLLMLCTLALTSCTPKTEHHLDRRTPRYVRQETKALVAIRDPATGTLIDVGRQTIPEGSWCVADVELKPPKGE